MQVTTITFGNLLKDKRIPKGNKIILKKKLFFEKYSNSQLLRDATIRYCPERKRAIRKDGPWNSLYERLLFYKLYRLARCCPFYYHCI